MAIIAPDNNYTDLDFECMRSRLFSLIRSVFPAWSDDSIVNFGNILVESFAFVGDVLSYYQNQQAREARFGTVQLRKNMLALLKAIPYEPANATQSSADITLTVTNAAQLTGTVTPVSMPVRIRTDDVTNPVFGEIDEPISFNIAASETEKISTWKHQATQPDYVMASSNKPNQEARLPFGSFLWGSESVSTSGDGSWVRVRNFLSSGSADAHYVVKIDQNDLAMIVFGDGRNGRIPSGNVTVKYKTGGGVLGQVEAGALKHIETQFADTRGTRAIVVASNPLASSGGADRETVESIRNNAPESLRSLVNSAAREDFEINARRVSEVGRALMLTSDEHVSVGENTGNLYVLPIDGGTPSEELLDKVRGVFGLAGYSSPLTNGDTYPPFTTFVLNVLPVSFQKINIESEVWIASGYSPSAVKTSIGNALADFFSPMNSDGTPNKNIDFGYNYKDSQGMPAGEVAWSDILNTIRDVPGVRKVSQRLLLNGAADDVPISMWQFPALGSAITVNGDTGNAL